MNQSKQIHNLIILDESGSMRSVKSLIIQGFNDIVETLRQIEHHHPNNKHFISFITFNGLGIQSLMRSEPLSEITHIDENKYQPIASTPLFDAIGFAIRQLQSHLPKDREYAVLVTILTDGEENASQEFSGAQIKEAIQRLQKENWTFTYIGTDHDVEKTATSLAISNTLKFQKTAAGIKQMIHEETAARIRFNEKTIENLSVQDRYYEQEHR